MRTMIELMKLGEERARAAFPESKVSGTYTYYLPQSAKYCCGMLIDGVVVFGAGSSMNECCDNLVANAQVTFELIEERMNGCAGDFIGTVEPGCEISIWDEGPKVIFEEEM